MKLHRVLVEAVIDATRQIFVDKRHADKVIEKILQSNKKWGARDRAFIAENTYEIVRWWRLVNDVAENAEDQVNKGSLWRIFAAWQVLKGVPLPAWNEFKHINPALVLKRREEAKHDFSIDQSIPEWLHQLGSAQLGDRWANEVISLNKPAELIIRANTLKTDRHTLYKRLLEQEIKAEVIEDHPDALMIKRRVNLFTNPLFQEGLFEVQDASSQKVAAFLEAEPGMHIIDACAGAGGKTLHLAALMQNKGRIISMDTEAWKLEALRKRARRAGAQNIETRLIEGNKTITKLEESADRVLLDVPCTGLGVLKRNPDTKWKLTPESIAQTMKLQQQILSEYAAMLKPGGKLVYATCSILPSENEKQVALFLDNRPDFSVEKQEVVSPFKSGFDGFYMALLKKSKN